MYYDADHESKAIDHDPLRPIAGSDERLGHGGCARAIEITSATAGNNKQSEVGRWQFASPRVNRSQMDPCVTVEP